MGQRYYSVMTILWQEHRHPLWIGFSPGTEVFVLITDIHQKVIVGKSEQLFVSRHEKPVENIPLRIGNIGLRLDKCLLIPAVHIVVALIADKGGFKYFYTL